MFQRPRTKSRQVRYHCASLWWFWNWISGGLKPGPCSESWWQKEFDKIIYNQTGTSKIYYKNTIRYHDISLSYQQIANMNCLIHTNHPLKVVWFKMTEIDDHKTCCVIVCVTPKKTHTLYPGAARISKWPIWFWSFAIWAKVSAFAKAASCCGNFWGVNCISCASTISLARLQGWWPLTV